MEYLKLFENFESSAEKWYNLFYKKLDELPFTLDGLRQDIDDLFLDWGDLGFHINTDNVCIYDREKIAVCSGKRLTTYTYDSVNTRVYDAMVENGLYLEVRFGFKFGSISRVDNTEKFKELKDCASDLYNRLYSMYNIEIFKSISLSPNSPWVDEDTPIPVHDSHMISWLIKLK